jgi:two-component system, cell cycle sensor histidine kinase and response regulator CckA
MNNMLAAKNRRVLVIDDNRSIHEDFRKILSPVTAIAAASDATEAAVFGHPTDAVQQTQFEVDSAYQGQEGLLLVKKALAAGRPYAMAFVDVRMPPGWDGVETTRKIWEVDPDIQIVLCTAYSDYSWGEMFEKIGQRDGLLILKKPFDAVEAFQLAHALTEKWWLHQQSRRKMEELESRVAERTRELQQTNHTLQTEVVEHTRAEEELQWKTAFLEAQVNSSIDGILVVDREGKKSLQNQRFVDLLKIPQHLADEKANENQLRWVTDMTKNPEQFVKKVLYLYAHPDETSRDEIELKDGTVLDRYSSPVVGKDGKYYGRIWTFRDITERKRAVEELRESERRFSDMLRNLELVSIMSDQKARITYCNDYLLRLTGWRREEVIGRDWFELLVPPELVDELQGVHSALVAGQSVAWHHENEILTRSGARRLIRWNNSVLRSASGDVIGSASIGEDITEHKRLEAQLFQSQKLETVGKLAGGVAHEFNSILTAIIGQSELLLGDLPAGTPLAKNATEISKAAGRAATLTRQLLAYGRKQMLRTEILDLNHVIASMDGVFHHLMGGEMVDVNIVPAVGLQAVKADAGQIEQVIMNIAINARDAMPDGGKLTLETANVSFDEERVGRNPEMKPGDYVMLAITDTGTGMSAEAKAHVFEPFFTTKGVGQGTGLGLSTCYGIIKQSGGHISVYSEPGRGTTFKIYLPQVEPQTKIPLRRLDSPHLPRGTETILLVEDDPALREIAATLLRRLGYTVLAAANGIEALSLKQPRDIGHIDLLFTDVVMPQMSGEELAERVRALSPHTRILFTSAYTANAIVHQGVALLQKPFTPSALAHKLREVLDQPGAPKPDPAQKTCGFTRISDEVKTHGGNKAMPLLIFSSGLKGF